MRTNYRNSARAPIDGVDFNAKCTDCECRSLKNAIRLVDVICSTDNRTCNVINPQIDSNPVAVENAIRVYPA